MGKPSRYNETLLKAMNVQPDETVLDIGCGPGTFVIPLAQQCQSRVCPRLQPRDVGYGAAIQRKASTSVEREASITSA